MDNSFIIGLEGLGVLVLLIAIRVPIAYSMLVVGIAGVMILSGPAIILSQLKDLAYAQFSSYGLSVVPMFILMGSLSTHAGLSRDLFRAANTWLGRFRGGVAMAAIVACAGFGSVCGSSLATASTMGKVALPELKRLNYSPALATGTVAAGGTLGILIPPSIVLVIYAIIVEANIVTMFMAAFVPGLLAVLLFILTISIYVLVVPSAGPPAEKASRTELWQSTVAVLPVVGIFGLVIGGIYAGAFNPTPAAAIGAFLVAIYGIARRKITWNGFTESLLDTAKTSGMIYLILIGAETLKIFMSRGRVPMEAADLMISSGLSPYLLLTLLLIALIVLGCFMDSLSMIILAMPFFWPVIEGLNFGMPDDLVKIWFGIIALIVVELGLITPPVGLNVFVINSLSDNVPMSETFKGVMPFFVVELFRITLIVLFPAIALTLPRLLSG